MVFAMDFFELSFVDMGVYLGGCYIGVPEKLLDNAEISPTGQQVGRKTMS